MALPIDLVTLDYAHGGQPFILWTSTGLGDIGSLDYALGGLPFYAQLENTPVESNTITVSNQEAEISVIARKFPNKRQEMVAETQIKQISPLFGAQYAQYIP